MRLIASDLTKVSSLKRVILDFPDFMVSSYCQMPELSYDSRKDDKNPYGIAFHCNLSFMVKPQKPTSVFSSRIFKITQKNHYEVVKFFHKIINWFYDIKMSDIFLITSEGKKVFNSDYKDLILAIPDYWDKSHIMKAWPSVIHRDGEEIEGIGMTIGNTENLTFIPLTHIEEFLFFLKEFRFGEEIMILIQSFYFASRANRIRVIDR